MSEAWQREKIAEFCRDADLSELEEYFLQSVVKLTNVSGVLGDNAIGIRTASFAVPWASSLFPAYKNGPLRQTYFEAAVQSANRSCLSLQPEKFSLATTRDWQARLAGILAAPIT